MEMNTIASGPLLVVPEREVVKEVNIIIKQFERQCTDLDIHSDLPLIADTSSSLFRATSMEIISFLAFQYLNFVGVQQGNHHASKFSQEVIPCRIHNSAVMLLNEASS